MEARGVSFAFLYIILLLSLLCFVLIAVSILTWIAAHSLCSYSFSGYIGQGSLDRRLVHLIGCHREMNIGQGLYPFAISSLFSIQQKGKLYSSDFIEVWGKYEINLL